ncbi:MULTISPECIES: response regulator transcription factor [Paenibacillus]|uniref:Two component transcriptional regulator, AraC family n=2 Tax=Paenibacillus lactis TaxID=228574 RepID=G4HED3_9BACL|nr:response regulator transcription factor [Paenibacillus lactis]EHB65202.1 two component transcriptional regulator, AraC family [Paenibacillus lactis 154]MBP1896052.1 two-component system response regulator YesN [Paenibacillus lactis]MCM3495508.1 response regulator transcription factor [Paenibacillus lactis]GIO90449.1 DNA-binding response regulator [Paenibacillus lactis]HAG00744.1 DNA-binding response regulator [Paenibacillus lactis]
MYKVFIVDDEPFIIEGLYDVVDWSKYGIEIVGHAENGRQALDKMMIIPVDILITDISMPVMTGLQLIEEARKLNRNLKVIILSGFDDFAYLKEGMRLGIENYLLKPINLKELEETIASTIDKMNNARREMRLDEYDMNILRSNILYRWITDRIEPEELNERATLLGLNLNMPYLMVSILRADFPPLETMLRDLMEREQGVMYFRDNDGDHVLIFMMRDPDTEKARAVRLLQQVREQCYDEEICISLGSVQSLGANYPDSYLHAKEAQEYYLLLEQPAYVDYVDVQLKKGEASESYNVQWPEYAKGIAARDKDTLFRLIDTDFEGLRHTQGMNPAILKSIAVEMVIRLKLELNDIQYTAAPDFVKNTVHEIMESISIDDLIAAVKGGVGGLVDSLTNDVKSPVIQQILHHIQLRYNEDLSLKVLGAQYHIHPVYLGHLFHKETGDSFTEYINRYRIDRAKELLRTTPMKVQDIAKQVGYWETGYFYKQFKKFVGVSPRDFRGML